MAVIPGGVRFTGFVAPSDTADTYYVTDPIYAKGGYREVVDLTARDAITTERRREGMMVFVQSNSKFYYLLGGIDNSNWTEFTGSGGVSYPITVDKGGTGLTAVVSGRLLFGNDTSTLAASSSLTWSEANKQLSLPGLVLTSKTLGSITAGQLEYNGSSLYFSTTALLRSKVLLETFDDGQNITLGTVNGTQIGTAASQKLAFYGATPVTQRGPYNISNYAILRDLDAQDLDLDQIGNLLGTLLEDLKALGLFS